MAHILLTGAGFSRNWGGWLANEAFEHLLGSIYVDDLLRERLWAAQSIGRGFEDVLADLHTALETDWSAQIEQDLRNLETAVQGMFAEMAFGYQNVVFEAAQDTPLKIRTFLQRFDAIYTLNQDSLIEEKYAGQQLYERFAACTCPGIKNFGADIQINGVYFKTYTPDPKEFRLYPQHQPYIKLHGSFNWIHEQNERLLIIGGHKAENIKKIPLLSWYHELFRADLKKPCTKLMVIGYSFNDEHINSAIIDAATESDLRVFIIDIAGVDVLRKVSRDSPPTQLMVRVQPRVIGASRRPLLETFSTDIVEFLKVAKFFGP